MASSDIVLKERELFSNVKVTVQIKRDWRVRIGLFFLKLGVWFSGAQLVEEFPMSLIQNDEPVEMK